MKTKSLIAWADLWRYPELILNVARGDDLDPFMAARSLLYGIAAVHSPTEALDTLLDVGEFDAAEILLTNLKSAGVVSAAELDEIVKRLMEARRRALDEIEIRHFELKTRALRVGMSEPPSGDLSVASKSVTSAHEILDLLEYEIQAKEEKRQQSLRERLSAIIEGQDEHVPERDGWQTTVASCINKCRFQAAERLLATRMMTRTASDPSMIPRRPIWPYTDGARGGLLRFRTRAEEGSSFRREWGAESDDQLARNLLGSLEPLLLSKAELLAEDVDYFVTSLDLFLGNSNHDHQVRPWKNGFSAVLFSLDEPCVPRLALCQEGVPIWIPRDARQPVPEQLFDTPALVGFHPDMDLGGSMLSFNSTVLFRLIGDVHRRINFIRWLARQIKPEDMMPATFDPTLLLELEEEDAASRYAAWFFDYHAIALESDSVLGLVGFYSAQSRHILCGLLGEIGRRLRFREEVVKASHIHAAWNSPHFREAAAAHLLMPLTANPLLLAVLACVYLVADDEEEVHGDYISEWLSAYGYNSSGGVAKALQSLVDHGLLANGDDDGVWVPSSPRVILIRWHMGDLETYIRRQLSTAGGK